MKILDNLFNLKITMHLKKVATIQQIKILVIKNVNKNYYEYIKPLKLLIKVPLFKFGDSIILPHHPEAQGIVSTPCSFSINVIFVVKGSLHDPNSPLDLQLTHLRNKPERSFYLVSNYHIFSKIYTPVIIFFLIHEKK